MGKDKKWKYEGGLQKTCPVWSLAPHRPHCFNSSAGQVCFSQVPFPEKHFLHLWCLHLFAMVSVHPQLGLKFRVVSIFKLVGHLLNCIASTPLLDKFVFPKFLSWEAFFFGILFTSSLQWSLSTPRLVQSLKLFQFSNWLAISWTALLQLLFWTSLFFPSSFPEKHFFGILFASSLQWSLSTPRLV